jgi:pimeloyl-ACP methyl ester carboxylesterase
MYFEHGIILTKNILYDYVQVDLLISFCSEMGLRSVVLVGHDDGGLLTLKTAEKLRTYGDQIKVEVKGVVLVGVSLSREVIPAFARILLHTPLRKKHMVRPLLRTEITQVINRRAWYDATKLTTEVLNLYKVSIPFNLVKLLMFIHA